MFGKKKEPTFEQPQDLTTVETMQEKVNDASVERGGVQLENSKKAGSRIKTFILAMGAIFALGVGVFGFISMSSDENPTPQEKPVPEVATASPRANFSDEMKRLMAQQQTQPQTQEPAQPQATPTSTTTEGKQQPATTAPATEQAAPADAPDEDELRRLGGNVMVNFTVTEKQEKPAEATVTTTDSDSGSPLGDKMTRTVTPSVIAQKRADLTYLLRKGTTIACTLHSKIVTTQPGFARCIVNKDVYSADGKVLLIERGSEIIGEQTTGLTQGQARIFIMWNTVETPKGVRIEIGSPSSDALGTAGQEAQVDTHFWERFGGAIMLSMIDDIMGIASNRIDNRDYQFENTQENVQNMADEALRNTINIPPTGYVNQGALLNIIVARDVDFRSVYELVRVR